MESERGTIRVGGVVVVDIAVVVDIHEVAGVAGISGQRPPVVAPDKTCFQNITDERSFRALIAQELCAFTPCLEKRFRSVEDFPDEFKLGGYGVICACIPKERTQHVLKHVP